MKKISKQKQRIVRHKRIRAKIRGTAECPRLSLYRSNTNMYGQLIDDDRGVTLLSSTSGKELATAAIKKGIKKIVFDRGGFIFTGRVKAFATEARNGGLEF